MTTSTGDRIGTWLPRAVPARRLIRNHAAAICTLSLFAADVLAFTAAAAAIPDINWPLIRHDPAMADADRLMLLLDLCLLVAGFAIRGVVTGRYSARAPFLHEVRELALTGGTLILLLCVLDFHTSGAGHAGGGGVQARALIATLLLYPFIATGANLLAKQALRRSGAWTLPVVIVGAGPAAAAAEAALLLDRSLGYRVVRRIDPATALPPAMPAGLSPLGQPASWRAILRHYGARSLVVAADARGNDALFGALMRERVPFTILSDAVGAPLGSHRVTQFFGQDATLVSYRDRISQPLPRLVKTMSDLVLAAMLLVLTAPLFIVLAMASMMDGGPMLFAHERVGADGRRFKCLKFRTMAVDCDRVLAEALAGDASLAAEWHATYKLRDDPRVTPVGRFLRKTSLDELPQLINVLKLDMSLVGPRPIVESEIVRYGADIAHYYATRPGLTGLWQVSGRSNTTYARRVQLDVWYVQNWTLWNDMLVLVKTLPAVLLRDGAV